jgi:hypothetical protein
MPLAAGHAWARLSPAGAGGGPSIVRDTRLNREVAIRCCLNIFQHPELRERCLASASPVKLLHGLVLPAVLNLGFCSILYEIVWLRLAMAVRVTSALTAIVLSMFMAASDWAPGAGRLIRLTTKVAKRRGSPPCASCAGNCLNIGPAGSGQFWSTPVTPAARRISSRSYCLVPGVRRSHLIPWCACMGARWLRGLSGNSWRTRRSFSYLYRQCTRRGGWIYSSSLAD